MKGTVIRMDGVERGTVDFGDEFENNMDFFVAFWREMCTLTPNLDDASEVIELVQNAEETWRLQWDD